VRVQALQGFYLLLRGEQAVVDVEVGFAADVDIGEGIVAVAEKVEGEDDAAVGAVFEGDYAEGYGFGLHGEEDV
jgi:hypothetical protein